MNLPWAQLRAVVVVIVLVFFGIILASTDEEAEFGQLQEYIDNQLEPYINNKTGYLHLMPVFTLRTTLANFIGVLGNNLRSIEMASQLLENLKQLRPFNQPPYTELPRSILMEIINKVTVEDTLKSNMVTIPSAYTPCVKQFEKEVRVQHEEDTPTYRVQTINLILYLIARWYKVESSNVGLIEYLFTKKTANEDDNLCCYEAALLLTVFRKIKMSYENALATKLFQDTLDDFLKLQNANKTPAKLISYTIQLGTRLYPLKDTGKKLQAEFQALQLAGSSQESPEIDLFQNFLVDLGLVKETVGNKELVINFENQNFNGIQPDFTTVKGLNYFEMFNSKKDFSAFASIFEGFKQNTYGSTKSLVSNDVFKWHHVMQFIASYGNMFKKKNLKSVPKKNQQVAQRRHLTTLPEPAKVTPKKTDFQVTSKKPLANELATEPSQTASTTSPVPTQPYLSGTGYCMPCWAKWFFGFGLPVLSIGGYFLNWWYSTRNTEVPVTSNTTIPPTIDPKDNFNWMMVIIMLVVIVLLTLACCAIWWYYWVYEAETSSENTLKSKVDKKKKKKKRNKASKVNSQPTSAISSVKTHSHKRQTKTSTTSPVSTSKWPQRHGKARKAVNQSTSLQEAKTSKSLPVSIWSQRKLKARNVALPTTWPKVQHVKRSKVATRSATF